MPPDVFRAVREQWKTRADRVKAFDVIACETGGRYNTTATNGQYLGIFEMGQWARSQYGHGETARAQARAAYRYWRKSGWAAELRVTDPTVAELPEMSEPVEFLEACSERGKHACHLC